MARVAVYTHVHRVNDDGVVVESLALKPGDEVPEWAHVGKQVLADDDKDDADQPKGRRRTSK